MNVTWIFFVGSLKHNLTTNGLQELADPVAKTALNPADIIDKYRECILNYSKVKCPKLFIKLITISFSFQLQGISI